MNRPLSEVVITTAKADNSDTDMDKIREENVYGPTSLCECVNCQGMNVTVRVESGHGLANLMQTIFSEEPVFA